MIDSELRTVADEFALGTIHDAAHLAGGSQDVTRLDTERGSYVVKRPWDVRDVELYATVECRLNAAGIRQARQLATQTGEMVASTGHSVQELLPGGIVERPTQRQTANVMRHLAAYNNALAELDVPAWLDERDTIWTRVTRTDYLRAELPALLREHGRDPDPLAALFARMEANGPKQLVHGDLGPDNVLMDGDEVVALIDFTPFHDSALLGLASAVYFFQLHDVQRDRRAIEDTWAAYGIDPERGWPALCREALRRLATPLLTGGSVQRRWETAMRLAALLG